MNAQEKAKQQAEVMLAFANGAEIEFSNKNNSTYCWTTIEQPRWDWTNYDFRVRQVPEKVKFYCYSNGSELKWLRGKTAALGWTRVPAEDKKVTYD